MSLEQDFQLVHSETGTRLIDVKSGKQFGEFFQTDVRSPEWKAALIVYEKYKRKMNLDGDDLVKLKNHIINFSELRKSQGKKVSNDFLVQECSSEIKRWNK